MRTETVTKLPLARWFEIMGMHPLHGAQVTLPSLPATVCAKVWFQHAWQDTDRIGRDDLAIAIREAEDEIERELKSYLMPSWEVEEWVPTIRPFRPELINLTVRDIRGYDQIVELRMMNLITGGIEAREVVQAGAAIVYTDASPSGDTYSETATVTQAVTFTDPCEVSIYYPGKAGDANWEIRPIEVSITAGVATITFRRELAVLEALMEALEPADVDGTDDASFLATVDVYRKYNDPQRQVQFLWEPFGGCSTCNAGSACAACAYTVQEGCLMERDRPQLSTVVYHPANWNAVTLEFDSVSYTLARQPNLLRVWYYSGLRDKNASGCTFNKMPLEWERVVAYFAASKLDRPLCECNNVGAFTEHWRKDLAIPGDEGLRIDFDLLANPFGTQRGAVYAWQRVKRSRSLPQTVAV